MGSGVLLISGGLVASALAVLLVLRANPSGPESVAKQV